MCLPTFEEPETQRESLQPPHLQVTIKMLTTLVGIPQ